MQLKDMFVKPIDRDIKGVIKVGQGDDSNVRQELEEYVVTRELQKHFAQFFSSYKNGITGHTDKMGVWISGFFGSGKSHFLKILSYVLENRSIDGKRAVDYFIEDKKIENQAVLADMDLAAGVPTDVILFNVDSKGESGGKDSADAISSVFLKVFNEMQGFCGTNPYIADLERSLSERGLYQPFKAQFSNKYGVEWESARDEFAFIQDDVTSILANIGAMTEEAAKNWCTRALLDYNFSIESFAKLVRDYIDKKGGNRHVVFMADEMGQYIGDNPRLILGLQTVTEDLGTYCGGKAWVIVTSQEAIDSVTKVRGNEFSKIQGRFDTRLSLSSANVDEVIRKRILAKNETAAATLKTLYENNATVIKNLIVWDDAAEKKLYAGSSDFAAVYPFIPYQFNLLGEVLNSIRKRGVAGMHLATGERSMLALFKESAVRIMRKEEGVLVPFNMFYDALEQFLEHSVRGVIAKAWANDCLNPHRDESCFDVEVLKTLFMIKYIDKVAPTKENITSLMVSHINDDRIALAGQVQEALERLRAQMLIQKNAGSYIFLTDEEQEINREINNQDVQIPEIVSQVSTMIFDDIYSEKRYRIPRMNNRYSFAFNQFIDDRPHRGNQNNDIGVNILTPYWDGSRDRQVLALSSSRRVVLLLPNDDAFLEEIQAALKIEKYLRISGTGKALSRYEEIKLQKTRELGERKANARDYLKQSLSQAAVFADGQELSIAKKDPGARITEAMGRLVENLYSKLYYIDSAKNADDVRAALKNTGGQQLMLDDGQRPNRLALNDLLEFIGRNTMQHMKTSLKTIIDHFAKAPYGFIPDDCAWLAACLFRSGDIAFYINNEQITPQNRSAEEITGYLTKSTLAERLLINKREKASERELKAVKNMLKELFGGTDAGENEDDLLTQLQKKADDLRYQIQDYKKELEREPLLPGKEILDRGEELLLRIKRVNYTNELFALIAQKQDEYLDFAEDFEPVKSFYSGEQKDLFIKAARVSKLYDESKTFIAGNREIEETAAAINGIIRKPFPYGEIHKLPEQVSKYTRLNMALMEKERGPLRRSLEEAGGRVFPRLTDKTYGDRLKAKFTRQFDEVENKIADCNNVARLHSIAAEINQLEHNMHAEIEREESRLSAARLKPATSQKEEPFSGRVATPGGKRQKSVNLKSVAREYSWRIENEADIDRYVAALRASLMKELAKDSDAIITVLL